MTTLTEKVKWLEHDIKTLNDSLRSLRGQLLEGLSKSASSGDQEGRMIAGLSKRIDEAVAIAKASHTNSAHADDVKGLHKRVCRLEVDSEKFIKDASELTYAAKLAKERIQDIESNCCGGSCDAYDPDAGSEDKPSLEDYMDLKQSNANLSIRLANLEARFPTQAPYWNYLPIYYQASPLNSCPVPPTWLSGCGGAGTNANLDNTTHPHPRPVRDMPGFWSIG